jgi:GH15 family glucan-1,4-alpha-glucosidase
MTDLFQRSLEIILANQTPGGAYIAGPNFPTYHYCWFRDGSFTAYAMDLVGRHDSAERFHDWAATTINARADIVQRSVAKAHRDEPLTGADFLHTRYAPDGSEAHGESWPNFQLDGFGTWLWALGEHQRLGGRSLQATWSQAAGLVADYVTALWSRACYDCWEEFPDRVHTYTLAAIYGGLRADERLRRADHRATLEQIAHVLRSGAVANGRFVKFVGSTEVDANLLGLATPFGVVEPDDPVLLATIRQIEADLQRGGGLHRYRADSYYGGGEWILLTAWLGWHAAQVGERDKAEAALDWIEAQADADGQLPEQVPLSLNDPAHYAPWRERWGDIARPLLWSHAKYLILHRAVRG